MVMSAPNILEVMSFRMSTRVIATVVYGILTQILCVVSQKKLQFLGDFIPQTSYQALPLDPAWVPRLPVFFYVCLNNPVRSTPLMIVIVYISGHLD